MFFHWQSPQQQVGIPIEYLIVGGGGSGAGSRNTIGVAVLAGGGGGNGGAVLFGSNISLVSGTSYTVTVGFGATGSQSSVSSGGESSFAGLTAYGGKYGSFPYDGSQSGAGLGGDAYGNIEPVSQLGSDGGDDDTRAGGGATSYTDGFDGNSTQAGAGGNGYSSSITGTAVYYGGAGGGGGHQGESGGAGGLGGGGAGGTGGTSKGSNATANTGGGGGGGAGGTQTTGSMPWRVPGNGGSGVVIIRLPTAQYSGTHTGTTVVTTDGSDTIIQFNTSGSYTA